MNGSERPRKSFPQQANVSIVKEWFSMKKAISVFLILAALLSMRLTGFVSFGGADGENIALNKPARSNLNRADAHLVTDGNGETYWKGREYPSYVDVDLVDNYELEKLVIKHPSSVRAVYRYTVYGSVDGVNYNQIAQKSDDTPVSRSGDTYIFTERPLVRIIRVYLEYASDGDNVYLGEVLAYGEKSDAPVVDNSEALVIPDYDETEYAAPITVDDTIEEVRGIVERTVGAEYLDWFAFEIRQDASSENDYYVLKDTADGKISVTANNGVSLAAGLNYYYKYYCNVHISQETRQTKMPESIVPINGTVRKNSQVKYRYAYNYCTFSYTMAFWGEEKWQNELDWLALSGVNLMLDVTGYEYVWLKFLMGIGYSFLDAKDIICGSAYCAWQYMGNIEGKEVPLHNQWFADRVELARRNHRRMLALGITPLLEAYTGMIPNQILEHGIDINADYVVHQAAWANMYRPAMLRTDNETYDEYAAIFYRAQRDAFGDISDYYGGDIFHEGGTRPANLSDSAVSGKIMQRLLEADENAVWVIQGWQDNPTSGTISGLRNYGGHALILDLSSNTDPKWKTTDEYYGTPWIYATIELLGGHKDMHGCLNTFAKLPSFIKERNYAVGIGFVTEGTEVNPVLYELMMEACWEENDIKLSTWVRSYITRRYGTYSKSANKGWTFLLDTVYKDLDYWHVDTNNSSAFSTIWTPSEPTYDVKELEKGLIYLLDDYAVLSESECYLYDVSDVLRQYLSGYQVFLYSEFSEAYRIKDLAAFREKSAKFLRSLDLLDQIQQTRVNCTLGEWLGLATDAAANYDDFSRRIFEKSAKALITVWHAMGSLMDYASRAYSGLIADYYKPRWEKRIEAWDDNLNGKNTSQPTFADFDNSGWLYVLEDKEYGRELNNDPAGVASAALDVLKYYSFVPYTEDIDTNHLLFNLALKKPVTATDYEYDSEPVYAVDGNRTIEGKYWGAKYPCSLIIDLGSVYEIERFNIVNFYSTDRYYNYEIYVSTDKVEYLKVAEKVNSASPTAAGDTYDIEPTSARYVKITMTYNSRNAGAHIVEFEAWGDNPNATAAQRRVLIKQLEAQQKEIEELRDRYAGAQTTLGEFSALSSQPKDVDGDGVITVSDALLVLRMVVGLGPDGVNGDANGDGHVNICDALVLLRSALGAV